MGERERRYRAAIIGHTGCGGYGHGLDRAFAGLPMVEVVAVADPDDEGRTHAQARTGAARAYADYHELLARERPDLVAVAPRRLAERLSMVTAAARAGAHLYVEKPLAVSLADADVMLATCRQAGVRMAVAHQGRLHPAVLHAVQLVGAGAIGRLRLVRGYGKMDHRGGEQDLLVLGGHVLDLMRLFAGDAAWVSGELLVDSRMADAADVRMGDEEIGPIAGNGLHATYGFSGGVIGLFESFIGLGDSESPFGLELVGETGAFWLRGGFIKPLLHYPHPYMAPGVPDDRWEVVPVPDADPIEVSDTPWLERDAQAQADLVQRANRRLVVDLLAAVEDNREPAASGERALAALEMIQAVAAAHVAGGRITLPLVQRQHPFAAAGLAPGA